MRRRVTLRKASRFRNGPAPLSGLLRRVPACGVIAFLACALPARAQIQGLPTTVELTNALAHKPMRSASGRFVIYSADPLEKPQISNWAESYAGRMERAVGFPLSFTNRHLYIIATTSTPAHPTGVFTDQGISGSSLIQYLTISDLPRTDSENLLETFCGLLVNGYVFDRQPPSRGRKPPTVPAWLSVGLAQTLHESLRVRNNKAAQALAHQGRMPAFAEVLSWHYIPRRGRSPQEAVSGLALGWLVSLPEARTGFDALFRRIAEGQPVTPEWVAEHVVRCGSAADLEARWKEWQARRERRIIEFGGVSSRLLDELSAAITVTRKDLGDGAALSGPDPIPLASLIGLRGSPRVADLTRKKTQALFFLSVGKAPEFTDVSAAYARFFEGLAKGTPGFVLRFRLRRVEKQLLRLRAEVKAREEYVDRVEREIEAGGGVLRVSEPGSLPAGFNALAAKAYLDDFERRWEAAPETDSEKLGNPP